MVDVVSPAVRSRMMAGIRDKDTTPELFLRRALHSRGFRYRLHDRRLPGKPDLVFPRFNAVMFAHGCFWHGHDCHLFKQPSTRPEFWRAKIARNRENDARSETALLEKGWRYAVVWECALKGKKRRKVPEIIERCEGWLRSEVSVLEIRGGA